MIVVCGEALIDMIRNADGTERAAPGGGPFNTARALARLGVPTAFLGRLSNDPYGRELADLLASDGASLGLASIGSEATTIAVADVDSAGLAEYQFFVQGTTAPNLTFDMLPTDLGPDVNALVLGSFGMALEPMASTLLGIVRREGPGRLVMLDPNVRVGLVPDREYRARLHEVISRSTIVKASDADLAWLYPDVDYRRAAALMIEEGTSLVAVTVGAQGSYGVHRGFQVAVEAVHVDVVDTIGAGDSFGAGLLAWLDDHDFISPELSLGEDELAAALRFACQAAAITCARAGADPPWKWEMTDPTKKAV